MQFTFMVTSDIISIYFTSFFCILPTGPNCFVGDRVISAGERVEIDKQTVCYCTYRDGTWQMLPHATCEQRPLPDPDLNPSPSEPPGEDKTKQMDRDFRPRLDWIP